MDARSARSGGGARRRLRDAGPWRPRSTCATPGIGRGAVEKALRSGRLVRVHTGVFSFAHAPLDRPAEWLAAVLACGDETVLGLRSAGVLWPLRCTAADVCRRYARLAAQIQRALRR